MACPGSWRARHLTAVRCWPMDGTLVLFRMSPRSRLWRRSTRKADPSEFVAHRAPDVSAPGMRPNKFGDCKTWLDFDHTVGHHLRLLEPSRSGQCRRLYHLRVAESRVRLRRAAAGRRRRVVVPSDIVSE